MTFESRNTPLAGNIAVGELAQDRSFYMLVAFDLAFTIVSVHRVIAMRRSAHYGTDHNGRNSSFHFVGAIQVNR